MDVEMPEMDGLEATAAIRNRGDAASRAPIVALTAHSAAEQPRACLAAGMDAFLSKPIKREELIKTVERLAEENCTRFSDSNSKSKISSLQSQISSLQPQISSLQPQISKLEPQISNFKSQMPNFKSQVLDFKSPGRTPQAPARDAVPFNLDALSTWMRPWPSLGGEMELFRQMVEFFFNDGLKLLKEILGPRRGPATRRPSRRKADCLKGTVLYSGAAAAVKAVARVETLGRSGDLTMRPRQLA